MRRAVQKRHEAQEGETEHRGDVESAAEEEMAAQRCRDGGQWRGNRKHRGRGWLAVGGEQMADRALQRNVPHKVEGWPVPEGEGRRMSQADARVSAVRL